MFDSYNRLSSSGHCNSFTKTIFNYFYRGFYQNPVDKGATQSKGQDPNKVGAFRRRKSITWGEMVVAAASISPEMEQSHFSPDSVKYEQALINL